MGPVQKEATGSPSQPLKDDLEVDQRVNLLRVPGNSNGPDQLAAVQKRVAAVVAIGVAFERRVGGEVKLSGQRLVPRRSDHVVDVLADAPWIMARHNGIEPILARIVSRYRRPVAKTLQIVLAQVIRLPDLDPGVRQRGAV